MCVRDAVVTTLNERKTQIDYGVRAVIEFELEAIPFRIDLEDMANPIRAFLSMVILLQLWNMTRHNGSITSHCVPLAGRGHWA